MKKFLVLAIVPLFALTACPNDADVASKNLSRAADSFEINRRIVFVNTMTGEYLLSIEGRCSLGNNDTAGRLSVTCMVGPNEYKKHFLGLSQTVSFFVEQTEPAKVSKYFYRVIFKPSVIIPDIDVR
jgi:hypothetical protein